MTEHKESSVLARFASPLLIPLDGNVYSIYFVKRDGRAAVEWKEAASGRL